MVAQINGGHSLSSTSGNGSVNFFCVGLFFLFVDSTRCKGTNFYWLPESGFALSPKFLNNRLSLFLLINSLFIIDSS